MRKELEESTNGFNSATILIADRRGREEVRRALKGMPSALRTRFARPLETPETAAAPAAVVPDPEPVVQPPSRDWVRLGIKLAIPVVIALATWAALNLR